MEISIPVITSVDVEAPILDVIVKRRSKRAYASTPVSAEKIQSLFEAARWAPSSINEQPWVYIYATNDQPELWNKILDVLNESNKVWAKDAPLLVVSLARKSFSRNGNPNGSAHYDVGAANAFLSLQATQLGLNVHQMGGYDRHRAIENLNVPNTYEPVVIMAIGYPGNADVLPEHLKQRELAPRVRQTQQSFVMNKVF
ncbi:MAG: nitroreductase family protein [Cyclobacteriaceae bacterium]|nr:nitroreductase family protein [Cyclobacteriaceae bacterium]